MCFLVLGNTSTELEARADNRGFILKRSAQGIQRRRQRPLAASESRRKKITVFNDDLGVQSEIDLSPYYGEQFETCEITKYRDTILVDAPEQNYQKIYSDISYSNPMDSVNASSLPGLLHEVRDRLYDYLDESYVTIREAGRTKDAVTFKVGLNDKFKGNDRVYFSEGFYMGNITCALKNGKLTIGVYMSGYRLSATGEWKERRNYLENRWDGGGAFVCPNIETLSGHDMRYLIASQTLFNSDKNYEYLVYTFGERQITSSYERDQDYDGEIDYISQREECVRNGFQIVQDNGNVLASVKIEDEYELSGVDIYEINGKYYICAGLVTKVGYHYFYRFYAFEKGNATSLQAIRTEHVGIKASPAVARRNEIVSIDLSGVKDARAITLTNSNGQTLKQQRLEQGQRTAVVNTNGLSAGMYIVNVTDGSHTTETCKIIIR